MAGKKIPIQKGDTLHDIGRKHRIDWKVIWNAPENVSNPELGTRADASGQLIRKPEWIEVGQELYIPDFKEIQKSGVKPNETAICTIREPSIIGNEIPRFDCHVHLHAQSIYRLLLKCFGITSDSQQALLCKAEQDNFAVASAGGRALVPMLLDLAFCPLWYSPSMGSPIHADKIAGPLGARNVGRRRKGPDRTSFDPLNMYPEGEYYVVKDDINGWCAEGTKLAYNNPGRCFPFVPFDPRRHNAIEVVKRCIQKEGFCGIKIYTRTGWRLSGNQKLAGPEAAVLDERVTEMLDWAKQNNVPILNHGSPGGWPPFEHVPLPKHFKSSKKQEEIRKWEQDIEKKLNFSEIYDRGVTIRHRAKLQDVCGLARQFVARLLTTTVPKKKRCYAIKDIKKAVKKGIPAALPRPSKMTQNDHESWIEMAAEYASLFATDLQKYNELTVAPQDTRSTRFCLAHFGGDAITIDDKEFFASLTDETQTQIRKYENLSGANSWLKYTIIETWLKESKERFVDLSYFTGVHNQEDRIKIYKWLLLKVANSNLRDRLLFGTDWPLTAEAANIALDATWETVRSAAEAPDVKKVWDNCWNDLTINNPRKFLFLDEKSEQSKRIQSFLGKEKWEASWMHSADLTHQAGYDRESHYNAKIKIEIDGKKPGVELTGILRLNPKSDIQQVVYFDVDDDGCAHVDGNPNVPFEQLFHDPSDGLLVLSKNNDQSNVFKSLKLVVSTDESNKDTPNRITLYKSNPKESKLSIGERLYVNCGSWTDGQSHFAAIMGNEVVIGSWGPDATGRAPSRDQINKSNLLKQLFRDNRPKNRMFVLQHHVSTQEFSSASELIVFIGDCHVHGLKGWACDNHTRKIDSASDATSPELVEFAKYLDEVKPAKVIQIGDLYEIWEVQALIELAYYVLEDVFLGDGYNNESEYIPKFKELSLRLELMDWPLPPVINRVLRGDQLKIEFPWLGRRFPSELLSPNSKIAFYQVTTDANSSPSESNRIRLLTALGLIDCSGQELAYRWLQSANLADALALIAFRYELNLGNTGGETGGPLFESCNWLSPEAVETLIRKVNTELKDIWDKLSDPKSNWSAIDGNHDTKTANEHLNIVFQNAPLDVRRMALKKLSKQPIDYEVDPQAQLDYPRLSNRIGEDGAIVYEHGDACDFFNNRKDFFRHAFHSIGGGYFGTRERVLDELVKAAGRVVTSSFATIKILVLDTPVGWSLDSAAERRSRRIFASNANVKMVVLGHTHKPLIQLYDDSESSGRVWKSYDDALTLQAGQTKSFLQQDVDSGSIMVKCLEGKIRVKLETRIWWEGWRSVNLNHTNGWELSSGHNPELAIEIPEVSRNTKSWIDRFCDQDNLLTIYAIENSEIRLIFGSVDREVELPVLDNWLSGGFTRR